MRENLFDLVPVIISRRCSYQESLRSAGSFLHFESFRAEMTPLQSIMQGIVALKNDNVRTEPFKCVSHEIFDMFYSLALKCINDRD